MFRRRRQSPASWKVTGWIAAVAFPVLVGLGTLDLAAAAEARDWPKVPGEVLETKLTEHRGRRGRRDYRFHIRYAYAVDGTAYTGTRVGYGVSTTDSEEKSRDRYYHQGKKIPVYVNPEDPADAVIERPGTLVAGMWLWLSPLALLGAVFCFWMSRQPQTGEDEDEMGAESLRRRSRRRRPPT